MAMNSGGTFLVLVSTILFVTNGGMASIFTEDCGYGYAMTTVNDNMLVPKVRARDAKNMCEVQGKSLPFGNDPTLATCARRLLGRLSLSPYTGILELHPKLWMYWDHPYVRAYDLAHGRVVHPYPTTASVICQVKIEDMPDCGKNPCANNGLCKNTHSWPKFVCECIYPWTGPTCKQGPIRQDSNCYGLTYYQTADLGTFSGRPHPAIQDGVCSAHWASMTELKTDSCFRKFLRQLTSPSGKQGYAVTVKNYVIENTAKRSERTLDEESGFYYSREKFHFLCVRDPCKDRLLCQNGGVCKLALGKRGYRCTCSADYGGRNCQHRIAAREQCHHGCTLQLPDFKAKVRLGTFQEALTECSAKKGFWLPTRAFPQCLWNFMEYLGVNLLHTLDKVWLGSHEFYVHSQQPRFTSIDNYPATEKAVIICGSYNTIPGNERIRRMFPCLNGGTANKIGPCRCKFGFSGPACRTETVLLRSQDCGMVLYSDRKDYQWPRSFREVSEICMSRRLIVPPYSTDACVRQFSAQILGAIRSKIKQTNKQTINGITFLNEFGVTEYLNNRIKHRQNTHTIQWKTNVKIVIICGTPVKTAGRHIGGFAVPFPPGGDRRTCQAYGGMEEYRGTPRSTDAAWRFHHRFNRFNRFKPLGSVLVYWGVRHQPYSMRLNSPHEIWGPFPRGVRIAVCVDGNDCTMNRPCRHQGFCKDLEMDYTCVCFDGFTGKDCSDPPTDPSIKGTSKLELGNRYVVSAVNNARLRWEKSWGDNTAYCNSLGGEILHRTVLDRIGFSEVASLVMEQARTRRAGVHVMVPVDFRSLTTIVYQNLYPVLWFPHDNTIKVLTPSHLKGLTLCQFDRYPSRPCRHLRLVIPFHAAPDVEVPFLAFKSAKLLCERNNMKLPYQVYMPECVFNLLDDIHTFVRKDKLLFRGHTHQHAAWVYDHHLRAYRPLSRGNEFQHVRPKRDTMGYVFCEAR